MAYYRKVIPAWTFLAAGSACVLSAAQTTSPEETSQEVFVRQVAPILAKRCWECHSGNAPEGDVRLDTLEGIQKGGKSGPLFDSRDVDASLLLRQITGQMPAMPASGSALDAEEVQGFRRWIQSGAVLPEEWPANVRLANPAPWSFDKLEKPPVPKVQDESWPANAIDYFILSKLEKENLLPSPPADPRTIFRRLSFDAIGLPPDPIEVREFLALPSDIACKTLVDKLLNSPHFGERWARYWLDVVRFAESNGFETNLPRENAWRYRDYVIRAFNDDKPYDRFVMEQLAGDVLGADEATGFLVAGPWDQVKSPDPVLSANQRADELHDMVSTTASAFLGLTVGCARCHDHKFDPITQRDYYSLVACLSGVQHGDRPIRSEMTADRVEQVNRLRDQIASVDQAMWDLEPIAEVSDERANAASAPTRDPVIARRNVDRFAPKTAKWLKFTIFKTNSLEPCIDELEVYSNESSPRNVALASAGAVATASSVYPNSDIHRLEHINDGRYGNSRSWISNEAGKGWIELAFPTAVTIDRAVWARDRERQYSDRLAVEYQIEISVDHDHWEIVASSNDRKPAAAAGSPDASAAETREVRESASQRSDLSAQRDRLESALLKATQIPAAYAGTFAASPETIHRLYRGDPMQPREDVLPDGIVSLAVPFEFATSAPESARRLALAKWIVEARNPLSARVIVNRLWQFHFGEGLVATPSDFGSNGQPASHRELLDWLACELMENQWSLKHIHRLIMTSQTYRQSSQFRADAASVDASTRWLWRFPPRRLEAEPIRDAVLSISGKLDSRLGGPGFSLYEPNDNYVRVYEPLTKFGPAQWRRMIYATAIRQRVDGVFGAFDCPDGGQIAPKRNRSTTPLQALNLLNSQFMVEQAEFLAQRLVADVGEDVEAQIQRAFELAFQREPTGDEVKACAAVARQHGLASFCRALFGTNEFVYLY